MRYLAKEGITNHFEVVDTKILAGFSVVDYEILLISRRH